MQRRWKMTLTAPGNWVGLEGSLGILAEDAAVVRVVERGSGFEGGEEREKEESGEEEKGTD